MPPPDEESRILDPCPNCTTLIDVTASEPFSEVHCPICGTKMRVRRQFNNFALQKVLGEGGMGTVFEAIDVNLQRPVAVKILKKELSAEEESIAKLETEARITASINHPHVVKVFSAGRDHGQFYLAMELVGKGTLDNLMSLQGRVAEIQVLDVGIQIADGLRAAAQKGLIHRDVKPGNILFADAYTAKVVDFGLAILMEDEARTRGEIWGTPYYVAPEKLNNEPEDFRSDIYSLGGTMFHAVSGRPPFEAASASMVALKHLKSQAVSLQAFAPDVSNETAYVINRMLNKDPLERYQSYDELIEHLKYAKTQLQERTSSGLKTKPRVVVETEQTRSITAWISLAMILLTLGVGTFIWSKRTTLFGYVEKPGPIVATKGPADADVEAAYKEAQQSLARGEADDATVLFDEVISANVSQPQMNWARLQKGLALLVSDKKSESAARFAELQQQGLYSNDPIELSLANFFVESGRLMSNQKPIPGNSTRVYGNTNFETMGLLLFAIKDWTLGQFKDAGPLLEKFDSATLEESYRWIADYKPLVAKYLNDYRIYASLAQKLSAATTPAAKVEALKSIVEAKNTLSLTGPLPEQLLKWEASLTTEITAEQNQQTAIKVATVQVNTAKETADWQRISRNAQDAIRSFVPETVLVSYSATKFSDPEMLKKKEVLQKRLDLLTEFKKKLISGLNTGKYTGVTTTRRGSIVPGQAASADNNLVHVRSPYGEVPVFWKDLSPVTVLDMAGKLINEPDATHKQWLAGVYQTLCGDEAKGRQMLIDLAQSDETMRDELANFFDEAKPTP